MKYSWNLKRIQQYKKLYQLLKYQKGIEQYQLLETIKKQTFNLEDVLIQEEKESIDFESLKYFFGIGIEYIPSILYKSITDFFFWCEDLSCLEEPEKLKTLNISIDDIITITHDIIASTNNKTVLQIFNSLIKSHKNLINFQDVIELPKGATESLGGITTRVPFNKKSYINVFRNHTIEDIEMFTHEVFHYIYNYLLYSAYKKPDIRMLGELEGQFGSIYATRFLSRYDLKEESEKLQKNHFNSIITSSYLVMINHILFVTSKNNEFDLTAANKMLNERLTKINIEIPESDLPKYLTVQGFEKITNIISYLIALELINSNLSLSDMLNIMYSLKYNDSTHLLENLQNHDINFYQDYNNFIKEYSLTHKLKA